MLMPDTDICRGILTYFQGNPNNFHFKLETRDQTWIHYFEPESKLQSKLWKHSGSLPTKKFKLAPSVGEVTAFLGGILKL